MSFDAAALHGFMDLSWEVSSTPPFCFHIDYLKAPLAADVGSALLSLENFAAALVLVLSMVCCWALEAGIWCTGYLGGLCFEMTMMNILWIFWAKMSKKIACVYYELCLCGHGSGREWSILDWDDFIIWTQCLFFKNSVVVVWSALNYPLALDSLLLHLLDLELYIWSFGTLVGDGSSTTEYGMMWEGCNLILLCLCTSGAVLVWLSEEMVVNGKLRMVEIRFPLFVFFHFCSLKVLYRTVHNTGLYILLMG